ncbi:MAG: hypothetical protein B1H07_02510 [Campylobacteraceae bacterium 4484_166]|nr:MAG: hypothetical protein B1H07_02510 [Campylobacteraceae bacterium 4484_166]
MLKQKVDIVVLCIGEPIQVGIYADGLLINKMIKMGLTSDILPEMFKDIKEKYDIVSLAYTNGPGSYMSIKVAYIFLKSFSLINSIKLFAICGFDTNGNSPIKAIGNKYFFRTKDGDIYLDRLTTDKPQEFKLKPNYKSFKIEKTDQPNFVLPVV